MMHPGKERLRKKKWRSKAIFIMREKTEEESCKLYKRFGIAAFYIQEVRGAQSLLKIRQDEPSVKYKFHCILSAYNEA